MGEGKNVRNNRSNYDLQYPATNYNVSFDTNKIIVEGAAAWNSGKKDDDKVFIPFAKTTLEDWKTKPFVVGNIRDGSCPEGSGSAVFDRLEQHLASRRAMELVRDKFINTDPEYTIAQVAANGFALAFYQDTADLIACFQ